jgi:BirA family biotin operon repressor/biotin-[acetyl-CoA-carboxylase] ligase
MQLDPSALAAGVRLVSHETIASTNAEALARGRAGDRGPLWITARSQSAGRGRRGRVWVSEPGNLYASLLLTDPAPPGCVAELSFVAALAVHDAVAALASGIATRLTLKWPNDLLIDGRKFSGILIEGEGPAVVVGIGVNCAHHPGNAAFPATDLAAAGVFMPLDILFTALSSAMLRRIAQWNRGAGFQAIRADWLVRAAGIGETVQVALPDGERSGCFETIDAHGRLILRLLDGATETVTAGDVFPISADRPQPEIAER